MKKWFDDWHIEGKFSDNYAKAIIVKLPYAHSKSHVIKFRSTRDARVIWLINVLESALYALTKNTNTNMWKQILCVLQGGHWYSYVDGYSTCEMFTCVQCKKQIILNK